MSRLVACCLLLVLAYVPVAYAEQTLLGAAEYTRYKRSYYIGALYAEENADKEAVFAGNAPAEMKILVTAKRLSQRDFRNSWVQAIAVNNDQATLEANTRDVLRFSNVLKSSLVDGDVITITTDGSSEVKVAVNGVNVETFSSSQIFPLVLNTWIGSVPPSTPFKNGIRGKDVDQTLIARLDGHQVSAERSEAIRSWGAPAASTAVAAAAASKPAASAAASKPAVQKPPAVSQSSKPVASADKASAPAAQDKTQSATPAAEKAASKPAAVAAAPAQTKAPAQPKATPVPVEATQKARPEVQEPVAQTKSAQQTSPGEKSPPEAKQVAEVKSTTEPATESTAATEAAAVAATQTPELVEADSAANDEMDDSEPELSEEQLVKQLLVRQSYLSTLQSAVNIHKHVPQQAIMRRVSGEVRVSVAINRSGKVQSIDFVEASRYDFFNKQAEQAIKKAAPFDPVPDALPGEEFAFEVLLYYPPYF